MDNLIGRRARYMTLYSPRYSLVPELTAFAVYASKHGGELLNEVFIYSKDITPRPGYLKGWRLLSPLDQKSLQELVFKAFLRIVNTVIESIASKSNRLTEIYISSN